MEPRTCATVAEPTPGRMARALGAALRGSEYAELRLDFLRPASVPRALELAGGRLGRCVCTARAAGAGGRFAGPEAERLGLLELAARSGAMLVDVEHQAALRDPGLARRARRAGAGVLVSWHDFGGTPGAAALRRRLASMRRASRLVKIVTTARGPGDAARVLSLYAAARGARLVAFAMGEQGRASRVLCAYMGAPFTYAAAGRPAAPGQMGLAEMRRLLGPRRGAPRIK